MDPTEGLAHFDKRHADIHFRLPVSSAPQRGVLWLGLANKVCSRERRRPLRVSGKKTPPATVVSLHNIWKPWKKCNNFHDDWRAWIVHWWNWNMPPLGCLLVVLKQTLESRDSTTEKKFTCNLRLAKQSTTAYLWEALCLFQKVDKKCFDMGLFWIPTISYEVSAKTNGYFKQTAPFVFSLYK